VRARSAEEASDLVLEELGDLNWESGELIDDATHITATKLVLSTAYRKAQLKKDRVKTLLSHIKMISKYEQEFDQSVLWEALGVLASLDAQNPEDKEMIGRIVRMMYAKEILTSFVALLVHTGTQAYPVDLDQEESIRFIYGNVLEAVWEAHSPDLLLKSFYPYWEAPRWLRDGRSLPGDFPGVWLVLGIYYLLEAPVLDDRAPLRFKGIYLGMPHKVFSPRCMHEAPLVPLHLRFELQGEGIESGSAYELGVWATYWEGMFHFGFPEDSRGLAHDQKALDPKFEKVYEEARKWLRAHMDAEGLAFTEY
jgi:hypothetical protein